MRMPQLGRSARPRLRNSGAGALRLSPGLGVAEPDVQA
ncbi:protein of unassigned function [Methylobacterium oryzae CBMB20]|uniref:Protein of unassigned function n=1 Tax=Methylobacterium oryzae CBMB20 TaxID=693986 RepID=A0A089NVQ3_9HYPH|nr:protein of unassigned function [Methylobacterium oryzae CBMB20]